MKNYYMEIDGKQYEISVPKSHTEKITVYCMSDDIEAETSLMGRCVFPHNGLTLDVERNEVTGNVPLVRLWRPVSVTVKSSRNAL